MKFYEIPQYINSGSWECSYSLQSLVNTIEKWCLGEDAASTNLQMNPDFQRGHVWNENQQIAFIEALLKGGAKNARVIYLNDPNWSGRSITSDYKDFVCVDGLQRYTAIKRFINNEIKVFGHCFFEFEGDLRMQHNMKINVNNLPTKKDVLQWYLEMNTGGTVHTSEEIDRVKKLLDNEIGICHVEQPYLITYKTIKEVKYNPNYGDDRICECGHAYYRHFDSYENMDAVGCKYCCCYEFKEKK